jgi:hypothetical protein
MGTLISEKPCACGCGAFPKLGKTFIHNHHSRVPAIRESISKKTSIAAKEAYRLGKRERLLGEKNPNYDRNIHDLGTRVCACGCGESFKIIGNAGKQIRERRFIYGHHLRGRHFPDNNYRRGKNHHWFGKDPWSKGLTKNTDIRLSTVGTANFTESAKKDFYANLSTKRKGTIFSVSHRKNLSIANAKAWKNGKKSESTWGYKANFRDDLGHRCRSTWEANLCRVLKLKNIPYVYEPARFSVLEYRSYLPDFYLPNQQMYIEVKGHAKAGNAWNCQCEGCMLCKNKIQYFKAIYKVRLVVIGEKEYASITKCFSSLIAQWEK